MPRRFLTGLPTISSAPYCDLRAGTRASVTETVRAAPGASVKRVELTLTPRSERRRLAATAPLRDWRHGRARTVTRSLRPVPLVIVAEPEAPERAVVSRIAGVTDRPPCAATAVGADGPSAEASCVVARPARTAA